MKLVAHFKLLVLSSALLGLAGLVATGMACGTDFVWWLFEPGRCAAPGSPAMIWAGSVATFGVGMKVFWVCLGAYLVWKARRG